VRRADLEPLSPEPDPVVMRGITVAPKHGVRVRVRGVRPAPQPEDAAPAEASLAG
jgi:hypothetical protein